MERIVNRANSFAAAQDWDIEQQIRMTPDERMKAARELKLRVYGLDQPDIRECTPEK